MRFTLYQVLHLLRFIAAESWAAGLSFGAVFTCLAAYQLVNLRGQRRVSSQARGQCVCGHCSSGRVVCNTDVTSDTMSKETRDDASSVTRRSSVGSISTDGGNSRAPFAGAGAGDRLRLSKGAGSHRSDSASSHGSGAAEKAPLVVEGTNLVNHYGALILASML